MSDDDRLRQLLREELDRREKEKQDICNHRKSGTIRSLGENSFEVYCDECGKLMGEHEKKNAFAGMPTPPLNSTETNHANKVYVKRKDE